MNSWPSKSFLPINARVLLSHFQWLRPHSHGFGLECRPRRSATVTHSAMKVGYAICRLLLWKRQLVLEVWLRCYLVSHFFFALSRNCITKYKIKFSLTFCFFTKKWRVIFQIFSKNVSVWNILILPLVIKRIEVIQIRENSDRTRGLSQQAPHRHPNWAEIGVFFIRRIAVLHLHSPTRQAGCTRSSSLFCSRRSFFPSFSWAHVILPDHLQLDEICLLDESQNSLNLFLKECEVKRYLLKATPSLKRSDHEWIRCGVNHKKGWYNYSVGWDWEFPALCREIVFVYL